MISLLEVTAEWHRANGVTLEKREQRLPPKFLCTDHVHRTVDAQDKAPCAGGTGRDTCSCLVSPVPSSDLGCSPSLLAAVSGLTFWLKLAGKAS